MVGKEEKDTKEEKDREDKAKDEFKNRFLR